MPDSGLPIGSGGRRIDLADDHIDHSVQELFLVGHMLVERHRDDPQLLSEISHAQCFDPDVIGKGDGGAEHPVPTQLDAAPSLDLLSHPYFLLTSVRRTPTLRAACTVYTAKDDQEGNRLEAIAYEKYGSA